jgi:hypothetical protein
VLHDTYRIKAYNDTSGAGKYNRKFLNNDEDHSDRAYKECPNRTWTTNLSNYYNSVIFRCNPYSTNGISPIHQPRNHLLQICLRQRAKGSQPPQNTDIRIQVMRLAVKAIHIGLVNDLISEVFVAALGRFIAHRQVSLSSRPMDRMALHNSQLPSLQWTVEANSNSSNDISDVSSVTNFILFKFEIHLPS